MGPADSDVDANCLTQLTPQLGASVGWGTVGPLQHLRPQSTVRQETH